MIQKERLSRQNLASIVVGENRIPPESEPWFRCTAEAAKIALQRSNNILMQRLPSAGDSDFDLSKLPWAEGRTLPKDLASQPRVLIHPPNFYAMGLLFPKLDPFGSGTSQPERLKISDADRNPLTMAFIPDDQPEKFTFQLGPDTTPYNLELIARLIHAGLPTVTDETIKARYARSLYERYEAKEGHPPYILATSRNVFTQHFKTPELTRDARGATPTRHLSVDILYLVEPREHKPWVKALFGFRAKPDNTTGIEIEALRASKLVQAGGGGNVFSS